MSKPIPFLRYGGLSPVKQRGRKDSDTYHVAPADFGIYAFALGGVEPFLLGRGYYDPRRMTQIKSQFQINKLNKLSQLDDGPKAWLTWKSKQARDQFNAMYHSHEYSDDEFEQFREQNQIWVKHAAPRRFVHLGNVWHHLEDYLKGSIIKASGSWVLTPYWDWHHAYVRARQEAKRERYSFDHLEVFIERIVSK